MSTYEVIKLVSKISCLVPLVVYIKRFKRSHKQEHIIALLMLICGVADLITSIIREKPVVAFVFNLQDIIQFWLLTAFYLSAKFNREFISWCVAIYLTTLVVISMWFQSIFEYQTLMWTTSGVIAIIYGIAYLIDLFKVAVTRDFSTYSSHWKKENVHSGIWINVGLLFYFCFSLWLFAMGDHIINELPDKVMGVYWSCHNVNNVVKNVMIAMGLAGVGYHHKK